MEVPSITTHVNNRGRALQLIKQDWVAWVSCSSCTKCKAAYQTYCQSLQGLGVGCKSVQGIVADHGSSSTAMEQHRLYAECTQNVAEYQQQEQLG